MSWVTACRIGVVLSYLLRLITAKTLINVVKALKDPMKARQPENIQPWASSWGIQTFVNVNNFVYYPLGQPVSKVISRLASISPEDPTSEGVLNITSQDDVRHKTINFIMANRTIFEELEKL